VTHIVPPQILNPLHYNPLKDLLLKVVDFARLNEAPAIHLFLNATNVRTGKINVWDLLCHLRKQGRETARAWLKQNVDQIGCRSTIDLAEMFL
jgi:hypothetical protein